MLVRPIDSLLPRSSRNFGGKARNLAALVRAGFPVPAAHAVSGEAATQTYARALPRELRPAQIFGSPQVDESALAEARELTLALQDVREDGVTQPAPTMIYWPALRPNANSAQPFTQRGATFVVRSQRAGTQAFLREVQEAVWSVNPNLPVASLRTMQDVYDASLARTSFTLTMLAADRMRASPRVGVWLNRVAGTMLVGFGIKLAVGK